MNASPDTIILIPTYNNAGTLADVVQRALRQGLPVLVVDDGSTDETASLLHSLMEREVTPSAKNYADATGITTLSVITHEINQGKGVALKTGFQEAQRLGYQYVVTLDADGQHHPEDVPLLMAQKGEKTLVVGSRSIRGKDGGSSFANKFSNFWFTLYTWIRLPDTQTGYRLYPLKSLPSLGLLSARYEAELTLLVFSAWKGLKLVPVPVQVEYPEDRVTHFRPGKDFTRISILNTLLLFVAIFYGYPRTLFRKFISLFRKNS
ncbi:MAG: glycosyltransferase family 2 protein [Bacteroidales bacterium]|nr:glycosyltransferase family 2 protein [Bacteroidales bacterium]